MKICSINEQLLTDGIKMRNLFFKPTPEYKEYKVLDLIDKNPKITQRELANRASISLSMVNSYIDRYEKQGYLKKEYISSKEVYYRISKSGKERLKLLSIRFLSASQQIYNSAKENISIFLNGLINKNIKKLLFYGAGEVAEIILQVIKNDYKGLLEVKAIIDDDVEKQNKMIVNTKIISLLDKDQYEFDGIFVSSYTNRHQIIKNLKNVGVNEKQIIGFF